MPEGEPQHSHWLYYQPQPSSAFTQVTIGASFRCGLTAAGVASCWGFDEQGALGTGTQTLHMQAMPVSGSTLFTTLSSGDQHTCGLTSTGQAWCWGENSNGQLGA